MLENIILYIIFHEEIELLDKKKPGSAFELDSLLSDCRCQPIQFEEVY